MIFMIFMIFRYFNLQKGSFKVNITLKKILFDGHMVKIKIKMTITIMKCR